MTTSTQSPLSLLVEQGVRAVGEFLVNPRQALESEAPSRALESLAGGLLVAMGVKEVSEDLDLEAVALLGVASVAGLKVIGKLEPGIHRLEDALYALEDLLRRTAPVRA